MQTIKLDTLFLPVYRQLLMLMRRMKVIVLALAVALQACAAPAVPPKSPVEPALTVPDLPTPVEMVPEPFIPDPPAPLYLPDASPEEQAMMLADALAIGTPHRLAAWLAVYDALGIPVLDESGKPLGTTGDDPLGPPYWRVWMAERMGSPTYGFRLVDFVRIFSGEDFASFDSDAAGAALLSDLRSAVGSSDPQVRLFGLFTAEMVRRGPGGYDLLADEAVADQVMISGELAEMLAWVVIRNLIYQIAPEMVVLEGPSTGWLASALPLWMLRYPQTNIQPSPRVNCSTLFGDETLTFGFNFVINQLGAGFQLPGMLESTDGLITSIQKHVGTASKVINATQRWTARFNAAAAILSLGMQVKALRLDAYQDPDPLIRTKTTNDGKEAIAYLRLTSDPESLPDGDNAFACLSSFYLNMFGTSFSMPPKGRIAGAEMKFVGGEGFPDLVLFADATKIRTVTNEHGEIALPLIGTAQRYQIPDDAEPVMKEFSIRVYAQPESVTGKTLFNVFFAGLTFGVGPSGPGAVSAITEILKTYHWDLGEYVFRIQDWSGGYKVEGFYWQTYRLSGLICNGLSRPFSLMADGSTTSFIKGVFEMTPDNSDGGSWVFSGDLGGLTVTAHGRYSVEGADSETPEILMDEGSWTVKAEFVGSVPLGDGGKHLESTERIQLIPVRDECAGR